METSAGPAARPSRRSDGSDIFAFIVKLNDAVVDKLIPDRKAGIGTSGDDNTASIVDRLESVIEKLQAMTEQHRPEDHTGGRFGSKAHPAWMHQVQEEWKNIAETLGITTACPLESTRLMIRGHFLHSFGNQVRIDYGTVRVVSDAAVRIWSDQRRGAGGCGSEGDVQVSFERPQATRCSYFRLVQHLLDRYNLEPAGSKGAWGIDHYQFLPFLLGSAQLISNEEILPTRAVEQDYGESQDDRYIFLQAIGYIKRVSAGGLRTHAVAEGARNVTGNRLTNAPRNLPTPLIRPLPCRARTSEPSLRRCQTMEKMNRIFTLGICAMASKVESAPMRSILRYLRATGDFEIIIFPEETILHQPITEWPVVECLIAFYSTNFPLEKAIDYVKRYKPIVLNDVERQRVFKSRLDVYKELQACHIPHPNYLVVDHEAVKQGKATFEEHYDYIVYNNVKINKPFIEKSLDADDHNNWIYYPTNTGGGCKKLFRKVHDRSSRYCADVHAVRRNGTYIYEEFMSTFGTDIKVYTVGCMFAHAEARKSPALDGKVDRNNDGKEMRYPVILTAKEKLIAYRIVEHFRQAVCGFDILRTINGPYVCDINGWSFVKRSRHHMDLSQIIRIMFLLKLQMKYNITLGKVIPARIVTNETAEALKKTFADLEQSAERSHSEEELCSVVVVMRHADRKPKQKIKFVTKHPLIMQYFHDTNDKQINLKSPEEMTKFNTVNKAILAELQERLGAFPLEGQAPAAESEAPAELSKLQARLTQHKELGNMLHADDGFAGINRKIQLKGQFGDDGGLRQVLIVAKWGGELTSVGQGQAEDLGRRFRQSLYPTDCTGLVRLHSTYRHDFKIFTSNEGRCQLTSAAFTKGILDLEGELTPILVAMTIRDKKAHMLLDDNGEVQERNECKERLTRLMESWEDREETEKLLAAIGDDGARYYRQALEDMNFCNADMHVLIELLNKFMSALEHEMTKWMYLYSVDEYATSVMDTLQDMKLRWKAVTTKLRKEPDGKFQYTMIADIVDNLRYDLIHHHTYLGGGLDTAFEIYNLVEPISAVLSPCEYGVTPRERLVIGMKVAGRLLQKIVHDVALHSNSSEEPNKSVDQQRNRDQLYAKLVEQSVMEHSHYHSVTADIDNYYGEDVAEDKLEAGGPADEADAQDSGRRDAFDAFKKISLIASTSASAASVAASSLALGSDLVKYAATQSNMTFIGGVRPSEMNKFSSRTKMEEVWERISGGEPPSEPVVINSTSLWPSRRSKAGARERFSEENGSASSGEEGDMVRQEVNEARSLNSRMSHRMVRSRYYVTSASILFSLLNFLKYAHYLEDDPQEAKPLVHYKTRDLHYLSHVVLRVWWSHGENGKPLYRLEVLVSPGAKDGFGQNYGILAHNARSQKHKYRRHISRFNLDYVHGQVRCKHCGDVIDPEFVRSQFAENIRSKSGSSSGVRRSASTTSLRKATKRAACVDSTTDVYRPLSSEVSSSGDSQRKGSRWYRCQRCAAASVDNGGGDGSCLLSTRSHGTSDQSESPTKNLSAASSREPSYSPALDAPVSGAAPETRPNPSAVPPYCELSRLEVINSSCDIGRLERLVNKHEPDAAQQVGRAVEHVDVDLQVRRAAHAAGDEGVLLRTQSGLRAVAEDVADGGQGAEALQGFVAGAVDGGEHLDEPGEGVVRHAVKGRPGVEYGVRGAVAADLAGAYPDLAQRHLPVEAGDDRHHADRPPVEALVGAAQQHRGVGAVGRVVEAEDGLRLQRAQVALVERLGLDGHQVLEGHPDNSVEVRGLLRCRVVHGLVGDVAQHGEGLVVHGHAPDGEVLGPQLPQHEAGDEPGADVGLVRGRAAEGAGARGVVLQGVAAALRLAVGADHPDVGAARVQQGEEPLRRRSDEGLDDEHGVAQVFECKACVARGSWEDFLMTGSSCGHP
ncbi:histidine acid phosphatase [Babesia caballi]|uniref:Inositol hexakisphosphate and diphosphoinositol-pentakisphosphate kinase n=1 Tax=Babesia caballi TaxID=5871 RepID=A0AAV4LSJ2_BABCB|nr:histidine acid phosphatase [Babesia caballi]